MSRLFYAVARGARLQRYASKWHGWCDTSERPEVGEDEGEWRIHPEDAELAYGPISHNLRLCAEDGKLHKAELPYLHGVFDFTHHEQYHWDCNYGYDERALFLLIMAEAMADMGV